MDHSYNRPSSSAWQRCALLSSVWFCGIGCLSGNGFKASDFTRDDAPAPPPVATSAAAPPATPPPVTAPLAPAGAVVAPPVSEPQPAETLPGASDLPIAPPNGEVPSGENEPVGESDDPGEPPLEPPLDRSLCSLNGNEVGLIGDSYIDLTTFTEHLQTLAREAGALGATDTYVDHALLGASMDGVPNIPAQWPEALADARARGADRIRLVVMTGGGNDILVNNRQCLDFRSVDDITESCKAVVARAIDTGRQLFEQLAEDGVEAIIYFYYPHLPRFSLLGGSSPNTMLDYSLPLIRQSCETFTESPCHFVDLSPAFDDGSGFARPELIGIDGIHPTDAGAQLMADAVWTSMEEHCLAVE